MGRCRPPASLAHVVWAGGVGGWWRLLRYIVVSLVNFQQLALFSVAVYFSLFSNPPLRGGNENKLFTI